MHNMKKVHIACDLDGTLAHYTSWKGQQHIGEPIEPVVAKVKAALKAGHLVTIFTARAADNTDLAYIQAWCIEHIGQALPITAIKYGWFDEFWDDKAVGIKKNEGRLSLNADTWNEL